MDASDPVPDMASVDAPWPSPCAPLRVEVATTVGQLELLEGEWAALLDRVHGALPFATYDWARAWWECLRRDGLWMRDALRVFTVRTATGVPIAFAAYMRTSYGVPGLPVVRVVQPIGADPNLTEVRCMLVAPEHEADVVAAVNAYLRRARGYDWIRWGALARAGAARATLAARAGTVVDRELSTFVLPLPSTWEEFRLTRPRNVRESLRKCYHSLTRDGLDWQFRTLETGSAVGAALGRFFELHARRAAMPDTTVDHPDYFASLRARRFLADVVDRMGRRGAARMFQLEIGTDVVAMRLGFVVSDTLYLYYSGFDPAWKAYSVMTTVVAEAIRYAIDNRLRAVNLSSGADRSKTRWRPDEIAYADAVVLGSGTRARFAHGAFTAARMLVARARAPIGDPAA